MTDAVLEYVIGNSLLALPLAAIAWAIGRGRRNPSAAHLAWVLVLVRLAMPPVASVPGLASTWFWRKQSLPGLQATGSASFGGAALAGPARSRRARIAARPARDMRPRA